MDPSSYQKRKSLDSEKQQPEKKVKVNDDAVGKFKNTLRIGLDSLIPTNQTPHEKATVIAVRFSNDDIGVAERQEKLCKVFTDKYNYRVEKYTIDASLEDGAATLALRRRLDNFIDAHGGKKCLLVFLYSGHAGYQIASEGKRVPQYFLRCAHQPPYRLPC